MRRKKAASIHEKSGNNFFTGLFKYLLTGESRLDMIYQPISAKRKGKMKMKRIGRYESQSREFMVLLVLFSVLLFTPSADADFSKHIEWEIVERLELEYPPLDVAASPDGKRLCILLPGEILLYSLAAQKIEERISVDEGFDMIEITRDEQIALFSTSIRKMKLIRLQAVYDFSVEDLPRFGTPDAAVTVVVFNDYQCPYCKNVGGLLTQIMEKFPGQVSVVYKNFPLQMHKAARLAAAAALAAERQRKFPEFHDKLFENQHLLNEAKIEEIAQGLELDLETFKADLKDPALQEIISRDIREGQLADVRGTPTVFVNGKRLEQRSLDELSKMIEAELEPHD
ncbi:MAG: DsbA family protein [Candidatus Abyssobacteria bacterium SURF_5]|uniref:DsbA family protein n=1 Tax=Abyssobacteria bacterium (strain SURF_5) TaxID=2093360 RepID=A0A3A4NDK6_ABYX5|nr:MAG: DsbA family protein [Candidatus Abyssubacteria bacterium SURF_5]